MRDLRHLEELSSSTAFGSWANDVVLALDRVEGGARQEGDAEVLLQAADLLDAMAEPGTRPQTPASAASLAAGRATRQAIGDVLGMQAVEDQHETLTEWAAAVRAAAKGPLGDPHAAALGPLLDLFDHIGARQLVRSNAVLSARKRAMSWTAIQPI